jgi:putative transposase
MNGRTHSREFKLQVCRQLASGEKRPAQLCREYQVAESLVAKWRKEYAERGDAAFTPKQLHELDQAALLVKIAEMERSIGRQALEIDLLQKAFAQLPSNRGTT